MNAEKAQLCAYIFLGAGIFLLILTAVLSFKFEIVQMLRKERAEKKKAAGGTTTLSKDFDPTKTESTVTTGVENKAEINVIPDAKGDNPDSVATTPLKKEKPISAPTTPLKKEKYTGKQKINEKRTDAVLSTTVVISSDKSAPDKDGTFVVPGGKGKDIKQDDYEIIENILVMNGNPNIISL